jgi:hypothetical protein
MLVLFRALSIATAVVTITAAGFITAPSSTRRNLWSSSFFPCGGGDGSSGPISRSCWNFHRGNRRSISRRLNKSSSSAVAPPQMSRTTSESDQIVLGVSGILASAIMLYSEFTLKTTGCGLPAGPLGIWGAAEGISYVGVLALATYSIYTKIRTGSGLPAGPFGLLGAAEGLSFLAIVVGIAVLGFQILDYGYIPNAVPVEGGICS